MDFNKKKTEELIEINQKIQDFLNFLEKEENEIMKGRKE